MDTRSRLVASTITDSLLSGCRLGLWFWGNEFTAAKLGLGHLTSSAGGDRGGGHQQ